MIYRTAIETPPDLSPDVLAAEAAMQAEYVEMYGEPDQDPDNRIEGANEVVVMRSVDVEPLVIGITAWSTWEDGEGKIRLMWVHPAYRGQHLAQQLLLLAETRMLGENIRYARFETGPKQQPAMRLYERTGYARLESGFGFYEHNEGSVFYGKWLG